MSTLDSRRFLVGAAGAGFIVATAPLSGTASAAKPSPGERTRV
ncbi:MAG: hypothetical protein ACR2K2_10780 [Mycobacteriales bacterium]